ncbi:MAG: hypothetical protein U0Y10_24670 [Spirosomataceae bacterium]
MNKIALSKSLLWLIAILLLFVLGLVFVWLWYDAKIQEINQQAKQLGCISFYPPQRYFL